MVKNVGLMNQAPTEYLKCRVLIYQTRTYEEKRNRGGIDLSNIELNCRVLIYQTHVNNLSKGNRYE